MPTVDIPNVTANDTLLVAAPSGPYSFIRVWGYEILGGGATNVSLQTQPAGGGSNTPKVGPMNIQQGGGLVKAIGHGPAFDCAHATELHLIQDGGAALGGSLQYSIEMI